ncbi:hypothetical protein N7492_003619 [Penicillium capsulatum]|uniref:Aminoglycoside phosphotransferase domain-containing protein n=1 Tax=Penicillium capsulatum TaxID=69766 RepID=A0A9W9IM77_9EURO|nr:hypothetical protein N7492_003619 [Penicillium capsulatum]KAJ6121798.1 hypothetical protein N7512_004263 [Penicillium capsulatum]
MADKWKSKGPDEPKPESLRAIRYNWHAMRKLQAALGDDPETDLAERLPPNYSRRLADIRDPNYAPPKKPNTRPKRADDGGDIREFLHATDLVEVIFPLSEVVSKLLDGVTTSAEPLPNGLSPRICDLLHNSETLWKGPFPSSAMIFKCSENIVVKAIAKMHDYTEYTTLQYLEHIPSIPAPKPLGLVKMNMVSLVFMTEMRSITLSEVWSSLGSTEKASISDQLNAILVKLRSLPYSAGTPLGGVGGEGCKDIRRHLRHSSTPITTLSGFEDFLCTSAHPGRDIFLELLQQLSPSTVDPPQCIVFTHGGLRPDNIVVDVTDNHYTITGILDWEYSGFYPEYYESVRCTNCLMPYEKDAWYLYLPDCVSLKRYSHWWLLDRVREARVV